jgi:hypothetical protein
MGAQNPGCYTHLPLHKPLPCQWITPTNTIHINIHAWNHEAQSSSELQHVAPRKISSPSKHQECNTHSTKETNHQMRMSSSTINTKEHVITMKATKDTTKFINLMIPTSQPKMHLKPIIIPASYP